MGKLKYLVLTLLLGAPLFATAEEIAATLYKSPQCSCCEEYAKYLDANGFEVKVVATDDLLAIKEKLQVPKQYAACHTTVIGDYAIEGHVPVESVNRLLEEKPEVKGIGLPGMPAGSPGMSGAKRSPFAIYSFDGSEATKPFETL